MDCGVVTAILRAVDPPGLNAESTRTGRLTWDGGSEETAMRKPGAGPYRIPGGGFGERANWARTLPYEFTISRDADAPRAELDAPHEPDEMPASLATAVAGYLLASSPLAAMLGGAGKVYTDQTTASAATRPFVLIEGTRDDPEGEADEDEVVRLGVVVQATTQRVASAVHVLLCDLLDAPGMSRTARRAGPFVWDGGRELSAWRTSDALELLSGSGPGGVDVWSWAAEYEFRVEGE